MITMALHQTNYDLRAFIRNRQAQFFTLTLPVLFLVIFAALFGGRGHTVPVAGGRISTSVYYCRASWPSGSSRPPSATWWCR